MADPKRPSFEQTPPQYMARRKPEALALMGDLRMHEMVTLESRLQDIQKTEDHGFAKHFRVAGEVLLGATVGAWVAGAAFYPAVLVLVVAIVLYLASIAISEAHADSIASFSRDFRTITNNIELVKDEDGRGPVQNDN